jgi:hypothetical protein
VILPDVNVLVYAFRADSPITKRTEIGSIGGQWRNGLRDVAPGLAGVLRVATSSKDFPVAQPPRRQEPLPPC